MNNFRQTSYSSAYVTSKRRLDDDDMDHRCHESPLTKKTNGLTTASPETMPQCNQLPSQTMPSITFASPDYRPPPRTDALWLQPAPVQKDSVSDLQQHTSMDEDSVSTDDELLSIVKTPSSSSVNVPFSIRNGHHDGLKGSLEQGWRTVAFEQWR